MFYCWFVWSNLPCRGVRITFRIWANHFRGNVQGCHGPVSISTSVQLSRTHHEHTFTIFSLSCFPTIRPLSFLYHEFLYRQRAHVASHTPIPRPWAGRHGLGTLRSSAQSDCAARLGRQRETRNWHAKDNVVAKTYHRWGSRAGVVETAVTIPEAVSSSGFWYAPGSELFLLCQWFDMARALFCPGTRQRHHVLVSDDKSEYRQP